MDDPILCELEEGSQRMELFENTAVIFYDEFPSNHREFWEAVRKQLGHFKQALTWLYPDGFNPETVSQKTILASTNIAVDNSKRHGQFRTEGHFSYYVRISLLD